MPCYDYIWYWQFITAYLKQLYNIQQARKPIKAKAPVKYKQPIRQTMRSVNRNH